MMEAVRTHGWRRINEVEKRMCEATIRKLRNRCIRKRELATEMRWTTTSGGGEEGKENWKNKSAMDEDFAGEESVEEQGKAADPQKGDDGEGGWWLESELRTS
jgi:hypothetical protein